MKAVTSLAAEAVVSQFVAKVKASYRKDHQDQLPWMRRVAEDWRKLVNKPLHPFSASS